MIMQERLSDENHGVLRQERGRFQNGRNFSEARQSRKTAFGITDLPGL